MRKPNRYARRSRPGTLTILERQPDGPLYRYMVAGDEDIRQALFDYLAADRVAKAWARKRHAKDADLDRLKEAVERY